MKISELRNGLSECQRLLSSFGATKQASELHTLVTSLEDLDELTVAELVKQLKNLKTASKKSAPKSLDETAIQENLRKLQDASHIAEAFAATVSEVLKDKRLGKSELMELARRFGGTEPAKTTKPAIGEFLKERRLEMRRQGGLGATIDRMLGRTGTD